METVHAGKFITLINYVFCHISKAGIHTKKNTNHLNYMICIIVLDFKIIFKEKSEHNLNDLIPNFIRHYGVIRYNDHMLISNENYSNIKIIEY